MSEQGWHDFLAAEAVEGWVILHGGATAVFRLGSLREAASLAQALSEAPGIESSGVMLTLADDRLTVRLSRDVWQLESRHIELARTISAVARVGRRRARSRVRPGSPSRNRGQARCDQYRVLARCAGLLADGRRQCG